MRICTPHANPGRWRCALGPMSFRQLQRVPLTGHDAFSRVLALPIGDDAVYSVPSSLEEDAAGATDVAIDGYFAADQPDYDGAEQQQEPVDSGETRRAPRAKGRVVDGEDDLDAIVDAAKRSSARASDIGGAGGDNGGTDDSIDSSSGGDGGAPVEYEERPERRRALPDLLAAAGFPDQAATAPDIEIRNIITLNSDTGAPGSLFVCVPCEESEEDGHDWADESSDLGAVAVIAQHPLPDCLLPVVVVPDLLQAVGRLAAEFYEYPSNRLSAVALVGSYGKTTTAWLARGMLEEDGQLAGMIGNTENSIADDRLTREGDIWVPEEEDPTLERDCSAPFHAAPYQGKYELPGTTPDALHLQKLLAGMADRGAEVALVELCPALAADGRADWMRPEVLVYTNVAQERASADPEGADAYTPRIAAMFERLEDDQTALINVDDSNGQAFAKLAAATGAQVLTYASSGDKNADIYAEKVKTTMWETEVLVATPVGRLELILPLLGRFNVGNILAAVGVGLALGVRLVNIVSGIEAVDIVPGRCELIDEGQPFPVIVDSASTPEQLSRLIDEVKEAGARRTLLVMGCPGYTTKEERAAMGSMAHFKADLVFVTNDSPGMDLPDQIAGDIMLGLPSDILQENAGSYYSWMQDPKRVEPWFEKWVYQYQSRAGMYVIEDRFTAIRVAVGTAQSRDVVLVTGRGHLDSMEYWDGTSPPPNGDADSGALTQQAWFDDRVECRNAVSRLPTLNGLKDLDRSFLPWTRYPDERDWITSSISTAQAASGAGSKLRLSREKDDAFRRWEGRDVDEEEEEEEEDDDDDDDEENEDDDDAVI